MARFKELTEEELSNLLENRDSLNTKNVIKGAVTVLRKYCEETGIEYPSSDISISDLNAVLTKFYPYGLQKHFEKAMKVDIVNITDFSGANKMFQAMLVKLKQEGMSKVQHKQPLSKDDLQKLYYSFDTHTPEGLQNKVFVDFMIYFCNRGRENLREIKKSDFIIDVNNGHIDMRDMATKNHKGQTVQEDDGSQGGRIHKTGNDLCPFASFMKYLSLLHPENEAFFQRPKKITQIGLWYDNSCQGQNHLGDRMKKLSAEAKLSRTYTNHCLRATSITLLDGYEVRHVMSVSGHQSEGSIRSYARTSEDQRKNMAFTLSEALCGMPVNDAPGYRAPPAPPQQGHISHDIPAVSLSESGPRACSSQPDNDLSNVDLLEMSSSQESIIRKELIMETVYHSQETTQQSGAITLPVQRRPNSSTFQTLEMVNRRTELQHSNYGAPVYSLYNSTVHIHNH